MDKEEEENYSQEISTDNSVDVVNFMAPPQHQISSLDKFSFADVMHFADFGPKLGLNQTNYVQNESDNSNYYNFNLVNDHHNIEEGPSCGINDQNNDNNNDNSNNIVTEIKNVKRKRGRSVKTSEEVESQRMTHIAVERNRRRQMNEHLLVLRSLMPSSYVQRGDQASIVGGAIEFVKELEQLLQCLESQKRRRLYGDIGEPGPLRNVTDPHPIVQQPYFPPLPIIPNCDINDDVNNQEDAAENKSFIADIEVKMIGFDALIKVLSRRRQAQLVKIVEALEDMQFDVVHTNITTIDQTVLYSFNVKITGETRCTAEYIANSVHQILSFIDSSTI